MLHLTAHNFDTEVFASASPVIVMFYADWCGKCAMMKPVFESIENRFCDRIRFCKADIENDPVLAVKYDATIVPTFVFFKNGQIEAAFSGIIDEEIFETRLQKIFRNC